MFLLFGGLIFLGLMAKNLDLTIPAKKDSCDVYEALFSQVIEQSPNYPYFLKSRTLTPNRLDPTDESQAPTVFIKDSGEYEIIENDALGENVKSSIFDKKFFDTKPFFRQILNDEAHSIKKCSFNKNSGIKFYDGELDSLTGRENLKKFSDEIRPIIVSFSNVAISKDGKFGLVYIEKHCGGLCGWGRYVLFEKYDNQWMEFGMHTAWVS